MTCSPIVVFALRAWSTGRPLNLHQIGQTHMIGGDGIGHFAHTSLVMRPVAISSPCTRKDWQPISRQSRFARTVAHRNPKSLSHVFPAQSADGHACAETEEGRYLFV